MLKPAPDTPWCATVLGRLIAEETDIPAGVVNIITSSDHTVGGLLSADPRVDQISFTGSTATGKKVMVSAAESLKKVFLELGGKSAFVILDDADLRGARWRPLPSPCAPTPAKGVPLPLACSSHAASSTKQWSRRPRCSGSFRPEIPPTLAPSAVH